jgi:hypothetical protein
MWPPPNCNSPAPFPNPFPLAPYAPLRLCVKFFSSRRPFFSLSPLRLDIFLAGWPCPFPSSRRLPLRGLLFTVHCFLDYRLLVQIPLLVPIARRDLAKLGRLGGPTLLGSGLS